jgi:hypothetical protein
MAGSNRLAEADRLAWGAVAATAVASLSGLVLPGLYRDGEALGRLTRADDSFRLLVVVPILAFGLWAGARGSVSGRLAAMGGLACLGYLYGFVVSAVAINAMTLAHVAAFGLSFWALVLYFLGMEAALVEEIGSRLFRRSTAAVLLGMAGLSAVNWGAILLGSAVSGNPPSDVVRLGLRTNPLYAIELAVLVPLLWVAGLRLLRHTGGPLLALPLLFLMVLLGLGLSWEAAGVAVAGGSFDAGQAVAGIAFALIPVLLLAPVAVRRGSR